MKNNDLMTKGAIAYIINRVIQNAKEAQKENQEDPQDEFYQGKLMAYYEILDTIKTELQVRDEDLKEYGIDIDIEKITI